MKILALLSLLIVCVSTRFAFAGEPDPGIEARFAKFVDRYLTKTLGILPTSATTLGDHRFDDRLEDFSPAGVEKAIRTYRLLQKELATIPREKLSTSSRIDYDLLKENAASSLFSWTELAEHRWNPQMYNELLGQSLYVLTIPPADPKDLPARLSALTARLRKIPGFLEVARANLRNPPAVMTDFVIGSNPGTIRTIEQDLPALYEKYPEGKNPFEAARAKALAALRDYQAWLEKDLKPRSKGDWRLGQEKWRRKLRFSLVSDLSPEEIYGRAEQGLSETRQRMYEVALPLFSSHFPGDDAPDRLTGDERTNTVVSRVLAKAAEKHGKAEEILANVRKWVEKIKSYIREKDLIELPPESDNFVIEKTPAYLDGVAVAFFNPAPAFEPDLKKSYWVSTVPKGKEESYLREYNDYGLQTLTIHEAFPGHYVQIYWAQHSPFSSIAKKVFESGLFAEGWAVFIEEVMYREGFAEGEPENLLTHLKMQLRIYLNAMIDARLHTGGQDTDENDRWALDLLMRKGFQEQAEAEGKLRRAKLSSTQLSTYFVGYSEIQDIAEAARKKAGASFKWKSFLKELVSYGTIPPKVVRALMEEKGVL